MPGLQAGDGAAAVVQGQPLLAGRELRGHAGRVDAERGGALDAVHEVERRRGARAAARVLPGERGTHAVDEPRHMRVVRIPAVQVGRCALPHQAHRQRRQPLVQRLGAADEAARADHWLRAEGQEGLLRIERALVVLDHQTTQAPAHHLDLRAAHLHAHQRRKAGCGIGPEQQLHHRQGGGEGVLVHCRHVIDHRRRTGRQDDGEGHGITGRHTAHSERAEPALRPGEVGIERGGQRGGVHALRHAAELQHQFDPALPFGQAQQRRGQRKTDGRRRPAAAAEGRPARIGGRKRCAEAIGRVGNGREAQLRPAARHGAQLLHLGMADHGAANRAEELLDARGVLAGRERVRGVDLDSGRALLQLDHHMRTVGQRAARPEAQHLAHLVVEVAAGELVQQRLRARAQAQEGDQQRQVRRHVAVAAVDERGELVACAGGEERAPVAHRQHRRVDGVLHALCHGAHGIEQGGGVAVIERRMRGREARVGAAGLRAAQLGNQRLDELRRGHARQPLCASEARTSFASPR